MDFVVISAILALSGPGGAQRAVMDVVEGIPLVGGILSGSISSTSAKAPPEPADMELIERLLEEGVLAAHPCDWYVVRGEDG